MKGSADSTLQALREKTEGWEPMTHFLLLPGQDVQSLIGLLQLALQILNFTLHLKYTHTGDTDITSCKQKNHCPKDSSNSTINFKTFLATLEPPMIQPCQQLLPP